MEPAKILKKDCDAKRSFPKGMLQPASDAVGIKANQRV